MSLRIAVDLDNVVLAFQDHGIEQYQLWFDRLIEPEHWGTWNGLIDGTHFETWDELWAWWQQAKLWDSMPPVPGALGALHTFDRLGIPFIFCTARPPHGEDSSRRLARQWETHVDFYNPQSKHLSKADLWIDDSPEVLTNLSYAGKRAICLDRPWNQGAPCTFRAKDWPAITEYIKEIS